MRVSVDESRDYLSAFQVEFARSRRGQIAGSGADAENAAAAGEQVTDAEILRGEDVGILEKLKQRRKPAAKRPIYYTTGLATNRRNAHIMDSIPLGKPTDYAVQYSPELLFSVPRIDSRRSLGIGDELPFSGVDTWNAWELTWLNDRGKPHVATAVFHVPADSPDLIESKSLKLYLNSLAMGRYGSEAEVMELIAADLCRAAGADVRVEISGSEAWDLQSVDKLPGRCIDNIDIDCEASGPEPALLSVGEARIEQCELHSHLLRSNCPVTGQPDSGSVLIRYSGPEIDEAGLLAYLVSYRQHTGFHEACVENIFVDILRRCAPEQLTVHARYNRRGGLDINPFRSNFEPCLTHGRLWRQ